MGQHYSSLLFLCCKIYIFAHVKAFVDSIKKREVLINGTSLLNLYHLSETYSASSFVVMALKVSSSLVGCLPTEIMLPCANSPETILSAKPSSI